MAVRFAVKIALIGFLAVIGTVWPAAPYGGAWAAGDGLAYAENDTESSALPGEFIKRSADPDSNSCGLIRKPWGGEDDEPIKALASSYDVPTPRAASPFSVPARVWPARVCSFLSPFKTGPPVS